MAESLCCVSRAPRLFIKEMIMRNFKSYADEQRVGPFHKSFSVVVVLNPNGSGKSNIIDAMLFMFGKRAKQDGETYEAVPGSDFVITCVAFRDNSSKYFVNDQSSNFTEVTK
ncbi:structural maintenance of chromosomes protein 4-like [Solanum stenotomum]|uniref:structural maintenance of chromosomes protein 4-like n=1 Tax=Solanum stenotomum TaxID=172797 RepID=UPI0020CFF0DE|nr:structural maintenance of chromosomes protein 4-like [Solanum stenotomum]